MFLGQCNGLNNLFLNRHPPWDHFLLLEEEENTIEYFRLKDEIWCHWRTSISLFLKDFKMYCTDLPVLILSLQHLKEAPCKTSSGCASSTSTGVRATPGGQSTRWTGGCSLQRYCRDHVTWMIPAGTSAYLPISLNMSKTSGKWGRKGILTQKQLIKRHDRQEEGYLFLFRIF